VTTKKKNILIIDHHAADSRHLEEALIFSGVTARIHVVLNEAQTSAFLSKHGQYSNSPTPDLILLDLNPSVINGDRIIEIMKTDPHLEKIPVFVLADSPNPKVEIARHVRAAELYIVKPTKQEHYIRLAEAIGKFLSDGMPMDASSGVRVICSKAS
jgi:two-component system, chemotaxis family, response regulator Rcp1